MPGKQRERAKAIHNTIYKNVNAIKVIYTERVLAAFYDNSTHICNILDFIVPELLPELQVTVLIKKPYLFSSEVFLFFGVTAPKDQRFIMSYIKIMP
jgi:hypothetical protein